MRRSALQTGLLIDIGNSRLKWSLSRDGKQGVMRALDLPARGMPDLTRLLRAARSVASITVVSVSGPARDRALTRTLRAAGLPAPLFVRSGPKAAGVTNGYDEPWRLGADRWVAAIGAWHEAGAKSAVCVIDIGTATTVDIVDARGRHRGGLIAPGPALMTRSLLAGTRGIAVRAEGSRPRRAAGPARDTGNALLNGALLATAGLIERAIRDARHEHGRTMKVYLTGGGAETVLPLLKVKVVFLADLVLRGLAVVEGGDGYTSDPSPPKHCGDAAVL